MSRTRFVVMVSGNGSNLQVLIDAIARGELDAEIVLVLSSDPDAHALVRARKAGIPTLALSCAPIPGLDKAASRRAYDGALAKAVLPYSPDYIFLLGWMSSRLQSAVYDSLKQSIATGITGFALALIIAWFLYDFLVWRKNQEE